MSDEKKIEPSQVVLSESNDGRMIAITTSSGAGTLLHRSDESKEGQQWDVITIEAVNNDVGDQVLSLYWGGTESSDLITFTVSSRIPSIVVMKWRLKRGLELRADASDPAVNVYGEVGVMEQSETV